MMMTTGMTTMKDIFMVNLCTGEHYVGYDDDDDDEEDDDDDKDDNDDDNDNDDGGDLMMMTMLRTWAVRPPRTLPLPIFSSTNSSLP